MAVVVAHLPKPVGVGPAHGHIPQTPEKTFQGAPGDTGHGLVHVVAQSAEELKPVGVGPGHPKGSFAYTVVAVFAVVAAVVLLLPLLHFLSQLLTAGVVTNVVTAHT